MKLKTGNQWRKSTKTGSLVILYVSFINKIDEPLVRLTERKECGHRLLVPEMKERIPLQIPGTLKG